jgi:elongation factor 1-beta
MAITIALECTSEYYLFSFIKLSCQSGKILTENSYSPSQADVTTYKAIKSAPDASKFPHAARWYKHIASYEKDNEFATLPGDASKEYTTYGPDITTATLNPAKAPAAEEDDDEVDLFGSDDEEEDAEAERIRNERLAEYKKKKEGKTKPAAKSVVTLDVKPWGMLLDLHNSVICL